MVLKYVLITPSALHPIFVLYYNVYKKSSGYLFTEEPFTFGGKFIIFFQFVLLQCLKLSWVLCYWL